MRYLSAAAIFKNEAPYMEEWLEFHLMVGVEHFYLFDNNSTDDPYTVLAPYMEAGQVTVQKWPGKVQQKPAYEFALSRSRDDSRWLAFIDLDEFLFSPTGAPLTEVLESYEDYPGVVANWCVFGPSGHDEPPEGEAWDSMVIETYTERVPDADPINRHVKSIVDPRQAISYLDPHSFLYAQGVARDENHFPVVGPLTESVSFETLRVNHYWTKSVAEARLKFERGRADTGTNRDWSEFEALVANCTVTDTTLPDLYGEDLGKRLMA